MDNRKYKTNDKDVRCALWMAYDKKDVYSGELLRYREMEIDHIIPKEVFNSEVKKKETLRLLGLSSDFEKDSLENFVPTRRGPNATKGDSLDLVLIRNTLNEAQKKKVKVEKLIKEYNQESDFVTVTTKVAMLADSEEKKQDAADIIFNDEEEFENQESLIGRNFTKSLGRIRIWAKLPTLKEISPDCLFRFRSIKLRECTIIVKHDEIFNKLFVANGEYDDFLERPFVNFKMTDRSYKIHLGGCSFCLSEAETRELCLIIDRYNQLYFEKLQELEEKFALNGMIVNKFAQIKLCVLKKDFCKILFSFVNDSKKDKEWDIFEINNMMIKVYTDNSNMEYNEGYHAIIYAREEDENPFWYMDRDVGLYLETYYDDCQFTLSHKDWWSPIYVKQWLVNELFPTCLKEHLKNEKRVPKNFDFVEECKRYYSVEEYKKIEVLNRNDMLELNMHIRTLQSFYSRYSERRLRFDKGSGNLYNSFLVLLEGCREKLHLSYITGKLGIDGNTMGELYNYIQNRKQDNQVKLYYSQIELLLRCFIECVDKGKANLSQKGYIDFWSGMDEIIIEYNYHVMREMYL